MIFNELIEKLKAARREELVLLANNLNRKIINLVPDQSAIAEQHQAGHSDGHRQARLAAQEIVAEEIEQLIKEGEAK